MEPFLKVEGLTKDFGALRALAGVSFAIEKGSVVGLLGPNGAGKTTCIDILLGSTIPNGGTSRVLRAGLLQRTSRRR